jgi:DNA primase
MHHISLLKNKSPSFGVLMPGLLRWKDLKDLSHKVTAAEYRFNCIFCPTDDMEYHLYVNRHKGVYHCFRCGAKGVLREGERFKEGIEYYDDKIKRIGEGIPDNDNGSQAKEIKSLPLCRPFSSTNPKTISSIYREYLSTRRISVERARANHIRFSIERTGIYKNCLVIPIGDIDSPQYFVCRKVDYSEPKYINAPWKKGSVLYTPLVHVKSLFTVICEGVFDALRIAKVARPVALLGKEANRAQIERLIASKTKHFIICLDPDAQTYAMKLAVNLKGGDKRVSIVDLRNTDPGDCPSKRLKEEFDAHLSKRS